VVDVGIVDLFLWFWKLPAIVEWNDPRGTFAVLWVTVGWIPFAIWKLFTDRNPIPYCPPLSKFKQYEQEYK